MRRRSVLIAVIALAVIAVVAAALTLRTRSASAHPAAAALGPLPEGFSYSPIEEDEQRATEKLFRTSHSASDVAVKIVRTPQDAAPSGVKVVAFTLRSAPDDVKLADELSRDLPLANAVPHTISGRRVMAHDGDATFSSAVLWARGRLAIVAYGSTSSEVAAVMSALISRNS